MDTYIKDSSWNVPQAFLAAYPALQQKLLLTTIPIVPKEDKLIWKASHDGNLAFKDTYLFLTSNQPQNISWAKVIWHIAIPPSKSLLIWRLLYNKLPTDDNLSLRGCHTTSICNLCSAAQESSQHLFMDCSFASQLWS